MPCSATIIANYFLQKASKALQERVRSRLCRCSSSLTLLMGAGFACISIHLIDEPVEAWRNSPAFSSYHHHNWIMWTGVAQLLKHRHDAIECALF